MEDERKIDVKINMHTHILYTPIFFTEGIIQPLFHFFSVVWQLGNWRSPDVHVDLPTLSGEKTKHVRRRGTTGVAAMAITLVVNSDVVDGCKMVPDVLQ